jgi:hypothetical protein
MGGPIAAHLAGKQARNLNVRVIGLPISSEDRHSRIVDEDLWAPEGPSASTRHLLLITFRSGLAVREGRATARRHTDTAVASGIQARSASDLRERRSP